jgi:hypothetical protein
VRTAAQSSRLAALVPVAPGGEPVLFAGPAELLGSLQDQDAWTVELERPALAPVVAVVAARALANLPLAEASAAPRRRRVA